MKTQIFAVKAAACSLLCAALAFALAGCGAGSGEAEISDEISALLSAAPAEAAATPAECDGVGALQWGESYDALAERSAETETVQFDAETAGFPAALFSRYSSAGKFYHGYYVFYETEELSGAEIFVGVRDYLLQTYGSADETESEATLESAVKGGESYTMLWTAQTSDGADVNIQLRYGDNSSQIWSASHVTLSMFNPAEAADVPEATAASAQSDNITVSIYDYVMTKDEYTLLSYLTSSIDIVQINSLISCDLDNDGNDDIVVFFSGETTDGDISHTLVGAIFSDGFGGALDIASDRQWCFEGDFSVNGETATCTIADPYSEAQITDEISFYHYYEGDKCFNVVIKTVDETVAG